MDHSSVFAGFVAVDFFADVFLAVVFFAAAVVAAGFLAVVFLADVFEAADLFAPEAAADSFLAAGFAAVRFLADDFGVADLGALPFVLGTLSSAGAASLGFRDGGDVDPVRPVGRVGGSAIGSPGQVGRSPTARWTGFCAECGCSAPATTWSFLICWRPRRFFGSMPRMAFSTAAIGRVASRSAYRTPVIPPGYPECR